jgi:hypothetical protein
MAESGGYNTFPSLRLLFGVGYVYTRHRNGSGLYERLVDPDFYYMALGKRRLL